MKLEIEIPDNHQWGLATALAGATRQLAERIAKDRANADLAENRSARLGSIASDAQRLAALTELEFSLALKGITPIED